MQIYTLHIYYMYIGTLYVLFWCSGSSSGIKVWDCAQHYCTHNLRPSGGLVGLLTFHPDPTHPTLFSSTASDTSIKVCVYPELTSSEGTCPAIGCSSNTGTVVQCYTDTRQPWQMCAVVYTSSYTMYISG